MNRVLPGLLCAALALSALGLPAQGVADASRLVPSNAAAIVVVSSVAGVKDKLAAAGKLFGEQEQAAGMAEMALMQLGPIGPLVDRSQPLIIALILADDMQEEPTPVFIVPVTDLAKVQETMPKVPNAGAYIALGDGASGLAETVSPLLASLPKGDVVVRVDLQTVLTTYGPMIDMGLGALQMFMPEAEVPGMDLDEAMEELAVGVESFKQSGELFEATLNLQGTIALVDTRFKFKKDSPLAKATATAKSNIGPLVRALPAGDQMNGVLSMKFDGMGEWIKELYDGMMEMMPADQSTPELKKFMKESLEMMDLMTGDMSMSFSFTDNGMSGSGVFGMTDAQGYLDRYIALMDNEAMKKIGITASRAPDRKVGTAVVKDITIKFSDKFWEMAGNPELSTEQMTKMMNRIFGKDGLRYSMAAAGDKIAFGMGAGAGRIDSLLQSLQGQGGRGEPHLNSAIEKAGQAPVFAGSMDITSFVSSMMSMVAEIMPQELNAEDMPDLSDLPPCWSTVYGGVDPATWKFGFSIDLKGVSQLAERFKDM